MRFGSALQITVSAFSVVPSSSSTPSPGWIARDRDAARELGARLQGRLGDREADHPHAALDVAPHRALPLEVALVVHQLDRGRPGLVGAAPGADDPLAVEGGLQALVGEVVVEDVGDGGLEHEVDHRLVATQDLLDLAASGSVPDPGVALALAELDPDLVEELLVGPVALLVGLRDPELVQVRLGALVVEPLAEGGAVVKGDPEVGVGREEAQAAPAQAELVDHDVVEQPDDVGARADHVTGIRERALEGAGAAESLAALEDQHALAGARQVGSRGEPVVAAADDDRVPVRGPRAR